MTTTRLAIIETATAQTDGEFCGELCVLLRGPRFTGDIFRCDRFKVLCVDDTTGLRAVRHESCLAAERRAKEMGLWPSSESA